MKMALAVVTSLVLAASGLTGCNRECGEGMKKSDTPVGGFKDLGYPDGAVACVGESDPDDPRVAFKITDEAEGAKRLTTLMTSKGWKPLPLPEAEIKRQFDLTVKGMHLGTTLLFGKDGSTDRYSGSSKSSKVGDVVVDLNKLDCTKPQGAIDLCK
jgi:hypothetical protein